MEALKSLSATTTGENIFNALSNTLENRGFTYDNITTDGTKRMIDSKIGVIGRINAKLSELNLSPPIRSPLY